MGWANIHSTQLLFPSSLTLQDIRKLFNFDFFWSASSVLLTEEAVQVVSELAM